MEKIVIRTEVVRGISSRIIQESRDEESFEKLVKRLGKDQVLKKIFQEKELSYQNLVDRYNEFIRGEQNTVFAWMYLINSKFGVVIDKHINLYYYNQSTIEFQKKCFRGFIRKG